MLCGSLSITSISSTATNSEFKKNFLSNLVYMSINRTLASAIAITVFQQDVFSNAEFSLEITGVDLNLIQRFQTLLATISSGERIDASKFKSNATVHYYIVHHHYYVKLYGCSTTAQSKALVLHSDSELDPLFIIHRLRSQLFDVQDNSGASATILLTLTVSPEPRLEPTTTDLLGQHRTSRPTGRSQQYTND
ncbi:uncharacterized protein LOC129718725 [Wyeomyia smithii]|uniref:uncharacterized protein LOC129718725 n=1 Tax=Wyeomyia smithii TaxID=174621 RepID=UPI002467C733|nr:uncharacterized protein LOC129718725 [Wyeomyia smithii]